MLDKRPQPVRFLPGSRAPRIIELATTDMTAPEIAKELSCTRSTVYKTIRRYKVRSEMRQAKHMKISALGQKEAYWLKCEARRIGVDWRDLARAMLNDAIHEAKT